MQTDIVDRWAAAFNANDADAIVGLYAADAVLLGTSSDKLYAGTAAIREYFKTVPGSGVRVAIGERRTIVLSDAAVMEAGFYLFTVQEGGKPVPRPARFTFVAISRDGAWQIAHHHSSALPPPRA